MDISKLIDRDDSDLEITFGPRIAWNSCRAHEVHTPRLPSGAASQGTGDPSETAGCGPGVRCMSGGEGPLHVIRQMFHSRHTRFGKVVQA